MLKATATFTSTLNIGQFIKSAVVPGAIAGVNAGAAVVFAESQDIVHVLSGELRASGRLIEAQDAGDDKVTAKINYTSEHAIYNEYGTGRRGAASRGAGEGITYNPNWPGMEAIPFLRPALDMSWTRIKENVASGIAAGLR